MPPWKPVDANGVFENERTLTDQEIQTIVRWTETGMAEGAPSDLPEALRFPKDWTYNEPAVVVQPDEAYTLNPQGGEVYKCFTMPTNSAQDMNVRGLEVLPGNREIVHHVLLFVDRRGVSANLDAAEPGPGYTCFGGPGFTPDTALGGWVPGMMPQMFPLGTGVTVPAGSRIVMQVHYSPLAHLSHHSIPGIPLDPDRTRIGLFLSSSPLRQISFVPVVNPFFLIPPGATRQLVTAITRIPQDVELNGITPHMHLLGREVLVEATFPNRTKKELIHITDWDFQWQAEYTFRQPILLPAGTVVTMQAWYDNSSDNPRNPSNPPIAVGWGERTTDEMCLTFLSVTAPGARLMTEIPYTIGDRGGVSVNTLETQTITATGYGRLSPQSNNVTPEGLAIFGLRQNGALVTEAAVSASRPISSGRVFAETRGAVNSGIAIANPHAEAVNVSFFFTDTRGERVASGSTSIPARGQIANFLSDAPFNGPADFIGSFSFSSTLPVSIVALRGTTNERAEFLLTTLSVAETNSTAASSQNVVFPHFADGNGWSTQILLVNPTDNPISGTMRFVDQLGRPQNVPIDGPPDYTIPARAALRYQTRGDATATAVGSVWITPSPNSAAPTGSLIFSLRNGGTRIAEAGVPATLAGSAFRVYVESSATDGIQSGVAVTNTSAVEARVTLELTNLNGSSAARTTVTIPANGQLATFINQIAGFESLSSPFRGLLRITSATPVSVIGLRGRYNERSEFLITTTPPVTETPAGSAAEKFFAHFANGGGYTTQFILFSGAPQAADGTLLFFSNDGRPSPMSIR